MQPRWISRIDPVKSGVVAGLDDVAEGEWFWIVNYKRLICLLSILVDERVIPACDGIKVITEGFATIFSPRRRAAARSIYSAFSSIPMA